MILPIDIKHSNCYKQKFQDKQSNLNCSSLKSKKIQSGTHKYLTNKNIMFGMGAIKPNRSRKIVANILNGLADVLAPKTNTKGIKKVITLLRKP